MVKINSFRRSFIVLILALVLMPLHTRADVDLFPYVVKGPVILGVTHQEAWVTWETAHHQGKASANSCSLDALTGTPNDTIPTLILKSVSNREVAYQDQTCSRLHKVHLTNLEPNTRYDFSLDKPFADKSVVRSGFTTAPKPGTSGRFKFIVYGDTRNDWPSNEIFRADHQALVDSILKNDGDAAFVLHTGDMASNVPVVSGDDRGYTEYFDIERNLLATHPFYAVVGNHEKLDMKYFDGLLDAGKLAGSDIPYYFSLDWGRVHVVFLNAYEDDSGQGLITDAQRDWLEKDLRQLGASAGPRLIFLVIHHGPFSYSRDNRGHGGLKDARDKIVPLMKKYGALAIFAGHDHYYQRGHANGIDYLVVGAGGAPLPPEVEPDASNAHVIKTTKTPSYLVVTVDGNLADGVTKDEGGRALDRFTFKRASD